MNASEAILVPLRPGPQEIPKRGVVDVSRAIGQPPGLVVDWAGVAFRVIRPTLADLLGQLGRTTQVITAKDAASLLFLAGVGPGSRVAEAGCGTGALTTVLAYSVGPAGRVISFDRREEFLEGARANLRRFGLVSRVDFQLRDVAEAGFGEVEVDGVVLDLPEPWAVFSEVRRILAPGRRIAVFTPTYNQLERSVRALRELGFTEVRSSELLERQLHVGEGGTRPEFDMLGHTGFLTGARRWS